MIPQSLRADRSKAGTLALLYDEDQDLRSYAIQQLNTIVPVFWAEISEELARVCVTRDVCRCIN